MTGQLWIRVHQNILRSQQSTQKQLQKDHLYPHHMHEYFLESLKRTGFYLGMDLGGVRGKCILDRGLGPFPLENVIVCLYPSTTIRQWLLEGKSFLYAIILNNNWEEICVCVWGGGEGEAWVFKGEEGKVFNRV